MRRSSLGLTLLVLIGVLGLLFSRSLQSGQVLFANDAPLGALKPQETQAWSSFLGVWLGANWIGGQSVSALPTFSNLLFALVTAFSELPVYYKVYVPSALLAVGLAAWFFFRRLGFGTAVCLLGSLAALLNTDSFSYACWGLPTLTLGMAATFLALAAVVSSAHSHRWLKLCLAGFAVGLSIMETYDSGAIFSLYIAAFMVWQALTDGEGNLRSLAHGAARVGIVTVCAALISAQALIALTETQVKGVVGMAQDAQTRQRRWAEATQWSLPKKETLRLVIPGLFGYRMDTPDGGNYWGGVGRDLAWETYLAQANPDPARQPHPGGLRHSGAGLYAGVLVVLVAGWAIVQAFRRKDGPFEPRERRFVFFWAGAALVSLLLAFGRHAPFYQFFYALPYCSTIRNPVKFLHPLSMALVILFGYGLSAMWRRYLTTTPARLQAVIPHLKNWWRTISTPDRRWTLGCLLALVASGVGWLLYAAARTDLVRHLHRAGFPEDQLRGFAESIARFSLGEVGVFILFLLLAVAAVTLVISGALAGPRRKWAGVVLGFVLIVDLLRANTPWVVYYSYQEKYATNPILELLRQKPYEQRVTSEVAPFTRQYMMHKDLYDEWLQRLFPYYNIQSLDIVQMPRPPELDAAYLGTFRPTNSDQLAKIGRLWQLTNTRLVLGPAQFAEAYNQQYDPLHKRFRPLTNFNVVAKPGFSRVTRVEELTAALDPAGQYAIFEFTGALPRAKLFANWQVNTNNQEVLARLADPAFEPADTVLVSSEPLASPSAATNAAAGRVEFEHYEPKIVRLKAQSEDPAVLLLNDRYHPDWKVFVDGKLETLLRCNFIMRGVHLTPGVHTVEFRFEPPVRALYVSLTAVLTGMVLCGALVFSNKRKNEPEEIAKPEAEARPGKQRTRT